MKRLIALEARSSSGEKATAASHAKLLRITHEAMALLQRAERIYSQHAHQPGIGSLLINYGHLQLDSGDIASAQSQADRAYRTGQENHDPILMTRARVLQAYVLMATSDEGLDGPRVR